ncbi:MAG: class I SAM-dependent methyltransferase [Polyangiaceae bacterium]|nr:class I SAM-dependent methyltransferase [Polyangiaceae bacterium]MCL4751933.1 class I SAM-dependent methyltransferase [Myxococcales bacterium]
MFSPIPWLDERVVVRDADVLVVDKPRGIVVHGGDEARADDLVSRLGSWLEARGEPGYLGVHQRLDKDASGILFFTRRRELNAAVARDMEGHAARRVYVAAVTDGGLPTEGTLAHQLSHEKGGITRVIPRGGQRAVARYRVLARAAGRALIELRPETGRTHQLRAQLAAVRSPIAGDRLYGGARANRLMLHGRELELPSLGRRFECAVPESFETWLADGEVGLGDRTQLERALRDALCLRAPLFERATAFRLCNGAGDELPGVVVDRYADFAVLAVSSDEAVARAQEIAQALVALGARGVYLKLRERADQRRVDPEKNAPRMPVAGEPSGDELVVSEGDLDFPVRLGDGLSTGLFVDQRDNRELVRRFAGGKRVLNLFSYTCSFSVAAARGGAREVVSVDLAQPALERGRRAFEQTGLDPAQHRFYQEDCVAWLGRARRKGERFGLVILDPPSFGTRGKRGTFDMDKGFAAVAADALAVLESGGRLLAVTNHRKTSRERLRKLLHEAARASNVELSQMKDLPSPLDCPDGPDGPTPMKSVLCTLA